MKAMGLLWWLNSCSAVHESDLLLRALIRRSASSHRRRPSAAISSRFGLHPCSCSCRPSSRAAVARAAAFNCRFRSLRPGRRSSFSSIAFAARTNRASNSRQIGQIMNVLRRLSHVLESVQQGCREQGTERYRRRIRSVQYDSLMRFAQKKFSVNASLSASLWVTRRSL